MNPPKATKDSPQVVEHGGITYTKSSRQKLISIFNFERANLNKIYQSITQYLTLHHGYDETKHQLTYTDNYIKDCLDCFINEFFYTEYKEDKKLEFLTQPEQYMYDNLPKILIAKLDKQELPKKEEPPTELLFFKSTDINFHQ